MSNHSSHPHTTTKAASAPAAQGTADDATTPTHALSDGATTAAPASATVEQPHHQERMIDNPHFWVGIAFVLFVVAALKYILPKIAAMLDARAAQIAQQLETAHRLRAEAEALMAASKQQQQDMQKEAEQILAQAELDVKELHAKAEADLAQTIIRRTAMADERIARAKTNAMQRLRADMVETATETARQIIQAQLQAQDHDPSIAQAMQAIAGNLNKPH